jgi:hypothetical protein
VVQVCDHGDLTADIFQKMRGRPFLIVDLGITLRVLDSISRLDLFRVRRREVIDGDPSDSLRVVVRLDPRGDGTRSCGGR